MYALPNDLIDLQNIDNVNVLGKGGKERDIGILLPKWKRSNSPLYDYEIDHLGNLLKLEIKKQNNKQWFDSGKYYLMSDDDKEIVLLLVNHYQGRIDSLAAIRLGNFIDLLTSAIEYQVHGWTEEVMQVAAQFKTKYPTLQFKAKADVVSIIRRHPNDFQILYERSF